jgi:hypothetical protein
VRINPSVVCEQVGDDVVVLDSKNSAVVTLTGDCAVVVRRLLAAEAVSDTEPGVEELFAQGVLVSESSKGLSRRSLVMSGVAVGAGGVLALSLPAAANASSASLLTPEFAVSNNPGDGSYWGDVANEFFAIVIAEDDFTNDDRFPEGFILEWSFAESFDEFYEFTFIAVDSKYEWENPNPDPGPNQLTVPAPNVDGSNNLSIWVRVRFESEESPIVPIVLPRLP